MKKRTAPSNAICDDPSKFPKVGKEWADSVVKSAQYLVFKALGRNLSDILYSSCDCPTCHHLTVLNVPTSAEDGLRHRQGRAPS